MVHSDVSNQSIRYKKMEVAASVGGAVELKARYSRVDLDDSGISGGDLQNGALGLNWYLVAIRTDLESGSTPNSKVIDPENGQIVRSKILFGPTWSV